MAERMNELDAFEQRLRGSLEQFEVPYNSADWAQLERALDNERRGWLFKGTGMATLLVAGALVAGGAAYLWSGKGDAAIAGNGGATSDQHIPASTPGATGNVENANTGSAHANAAGQAGTQVSFDHSGNTPEGPSSNGAGIHAAGIVSTAHTPDHLHSTSNGEQAATTKAPATSNAAAPATAKAAETPKAEPTFHASVSQGCPGAPVHFKVEHMPEDGIYLWNFGDGSFSNKPNPEHTFSKPGTYQVMLSMSASGVGTIHNKPSSDVIVIHEPPQAAFNILKQEYDGHIPSVHFENRAMGGKTYAWSFGDGATSSIAHPDHIYKKKGVYQVELTVTNEIGCVDKTLREVLIEKDYNLDAPTAFSPNGDNIDETFIPEALRQLGVKFHLAVYDTNGGLLYETNDATKPWTGRLNNRGDVLPAGEYVWVVDVSENLHLDETYTGKVKLVR
ncbi:MAG: PKD domain-containing protein [Flavobacteriales bacterium]